MEEDKKRPETEVRQLDATEPAQLEKELDTKTEVQSPSMATELGNLANQNSVSAEESDLAALRAKLEKAKKLKAALLRGEEEILAMERIAQAYENANPVSMRERIAEKMRDPKLDSFWKLLISRETNKERLRLFEMMPILRDKQLFGDEDKLYNDLLKLQEQLDLQVTHPETGILAGIEKLPKESGFRQAVMDHIHARVREETKSPMRKTLKTCS